MHAFSRARLKAHARHKVTRCLSGGEKMSSSSVPLVGAFDFSAKILVRSIVRSNDKLQSTSCLDIDRVIKLYMFLKDRKSINI